MKVYVFIYMILS